MKIITDSGCDFTVGMKAKDGISVFKVPLSLQLGERNFIDDETLDANSYLEEMNGCVHTPKTAAPSPELYMENFSGEESVFAVTLSSKLSASYQNAMLAKQMYLDANVNKFIHIFDSLSASVGQTVIVMKLNEFIKRNLSENEIVERANAYIKEMRTYFVLDRYDNLVKNGRLKPYVAKIASILGIKLICQGVNGEIALKDKVRGMSKSLIRIAEIIAAEKLNLADRVLGISHVNCADKAEMLKEEILKRVPFKTVVVAEAGGISTTYADRNGLIVSY